MNIMLAITMIIMKIMIINNDKVIIKIIMIM